MFNLSALGGKRCALCSVFGRRMTNCFDSDFAVAAIDNISFKQKKIIQSKKKTIKSMIKSMKKIVKTVLIFETLSLVFESSVAAAEFSNSVMSDALKRLDSSFVDFSKRQIFSFFVVFSFLFFHRDETSFQIAFLSLELSRINRNLAQFKKKMHSKVFDLARKIIKVATNVTQFSIVFDDLKKAMRMLKNRLLTMKKLIKNERMMTLFSKIDSERKAFAFFAEIADERVFTIENDHENQKDKFFNRSRKINRID